MLLLGYVKHAVRRRKKSGFIKKQEASGLFGQAGIRILLSKVPEFCDIFFRKSIINFLEKLF